MGLEIFLWDRMGPDLCGMGYPGPCLAWDQDRDGSRLSWDGISHPGPTASLIYFMKISAYILIEEEKEEEK